MLVVYYYGQLGENAISIEVSKYRVQVLVKEYNNIAMTHLQLVVLYQDVHEDDNTIALVQQVLNQDDTVTVEDTGDSILSSIVLLLTQSGSAQNNNEDNSIATMQLAWNNYSYRMKFTLTTEDSSCTEDRIYLNTATSDGDYCNDTMRKNGERTTRY